LGIKPKASRFQVPFMSSSKYTNLCTIIASFY
jgi:hypothetical protein